MATLKPFGLCKRISWAIRGQIFPENLHIQPEIFRLNPPEVRQKYQKNTVYKGFSLLSSIYRVFSLRVGNGTRTHDLQSHNLTR